MHPRIRDGLRTLAAGLLALGLALPLVAADEPAEGKALDRELNRSLRDVINRGADLYNGGDPAGCYQLFRGALMAARPALGADVQKSVEAALADAERAPDPRRKAWLLRRSLDDVRAQLGGKPLEKAPEPKAAKEETDVPKAKEKPKEKEKDKEKDDKKDEEKKENKDKE